MNSLFAKAIPLISQVEPVVRWGEVSGVLGLVVEVSGMARQLSVGASCRIRTALDTWITAEVVGFRDGRALVMPYGGTDGIGLGSRVESSARGTIRPSMGWLGRVIDAFGDPVDGKGPLPAGLLSQPIRGNPPNAYSRRRVHGKIATGVRAIDVFTPICVGQRMGIFAGSGVGKSSMMSMLARWSSADVIVMGLIGERGREVQEFIQEDLGAEGLARSVLVVATSNEPPLVRREAAYMAMAVAEHFRDQGLHVVCMLDSVTRFAMAQREIGLAAGEPPTTKGYVPSCFTELARLLERAGPGDPARDQGDITGIFTVLVDGGDHDEPVADAVRGILDGHIVLDRTIGERGRYPAINILKSVSRTMPGCHTDEENRIVNEARRLLARYEDVADLARIGAYKRGSDNETDKAIELNPALENLLGQSNKNRSEPIDGFAGFAEIVGI
jgi:flagellum-specific ATP synthase